MDIDANRPCWNCGLAARYVKSRVNSEKWMCVSCGSSYDPIEIVADNPAPKDVLLPARHGTCLCGTVNAGQVFDPSECPVHGRV